MKISLTALKRPITTFMFFLALVLFGFVSLKELSVDLLPDISYPRLSVVTQYRGVAPEEIEILVNRPLEAAVSRIPGLRKVESISRDGFSYMVLEFAWGTDMDFTLLHTREKLDSARYSLPEDCDDPRIIPRDPQSQPVMIITVSGEGSLLELKEYSEEVIKPRLEQIDGIGSAEIAGGIEREIHIEIDPELLSLYELSLEEISHKLDGFNKNLQGGTIRKGRFKYAMRVIGEFENLDEIGKISLNHTMGKGMVRLKDIARIEDSIKEREGIAKLNGEESIGILIRKESDANTVEVTSAAKKLIRDLREDNERITILVVSEQAEYIKNAISSVVKSIIFGGILAFLVLFVFLQDRKTPVIIAVVIPIAVVTTFNLLYFEDISVNIMSLGGLALGIGMLVDNSIIVSESIFRHKSLGKNGFEAGYQGTKEVGMAVTASTLTTISVFVPVIYVHGVAGQMFKDQALTVTFALISSLVVSLTLLPVLSSRKMKVSREEKKPKKKSILPRREPE
ncbi:MAG: efflux RND transporter permease subunit, partial [Candidatus Aminicenantaceae bacterium]